MDAMNKSVGLTKDKVIGDLLRRVISDIKPQLHKNLRLDKWLIQFNLHQLNHDLDVLLEGTIC